MRASSSTAPICAQPTPTSDHTPTEEAGPFPSATPPGGKNGDNATTTTVVLMPDQPGRQLIDVPKGLETLTQADVLIVKQKVNDRTGPSYRDWISRPS